MTMPLQQFLYLLWLAPFAFGALLYCTLAMFYWRQLRQRRGAGSGVFGVFTAVCGLAFLLNLAAQAESLQTLVAPALDVATGMVPPLLLHLVYRKEQCALAWLRSGFYAIAIAVACTMGGVDAGLLPAAWADPLESAPALLLGAAGLLGLVLQGISRRRRDAAERRYLTWTAVLLCLMLLASVATLLQLSPAVRLLPDYLLLAFFCVTLYYKERLVFFDLVLKRGAFLAFSLLMLATFSLVRPATAWGQWLMLAPLFLAGPWIYGLLTRTIDRVWLRRRYTVAEAERRFAAAVQTAENERDLRTRAALALSEVFDAPAEVRFGSASTAEAAGSIGAAIGAHGGVTLSARANSVPYLSDDRNLLQSLGRTLGVVLENVRFREREEHLRGLASRAELKALRAQINPHFLFNALNAIAGLIHTRPALAEETVEQLAEVFRYTLRKSEKEWVRVDEELEFVAAYLRVEEARFGERLQVKMSVDAAATAIQVPAMSIQPLVENAIKHGTSTVEGQGKVGLSVTLDQEALCIEVRDNGPGFPPGFALAAPGSGHGLRNVAERLSGYYGDSAQLSWENCTEGTRVRLKIPRRGAATAARTLL
ncbi:MAG: histidine kinase [Candidatus Solibacter sp.]|nr:histidine kinase [Candidatus Solibacter sp.]